MRRERVACFVDGFNLYHAIVRLGAPHLKWLDLSALMRRFIHPGSQEIDGIHYFSASAE